MIAISWKAGTDKGTMIGNVIYDDCIEEITAARFKAIRLEIQQNILERQPLIRFYDDGVIIENIMELANG